MVIWWIGNVVLLALIAPVVVFLLRGVLDAAQSVRQTVEDIGPVATAMVDDLDALPELLDTDSYVSQTTDGLARYAAALDEIL